MKNALARGMVQPVVIQAKGLTKVFQTEDIETHALGGIDLTIGSGEFLSIVGPSGCGKSTLLAILGLMDQPSAGELLLWGENVSSLGDKALSSRRNEQVGFIFQSFNLIGDLTVEQNVELPLLYRRTPKEQRKEKVTNALERLGMAHRARHSPGQLSGGQQQRVAVARALVGDPALLLADEPTGNLDSISGEGTMSLLEELHETGATICMVTHNREFARRAQRSVQMSDGHIVHEQG